MDLKEFVRDALVDVIEGIAEAQKKSPGGAKINPPLKREWIKNDRGRGEEQLDSENLKNANMLATHYEGGFADIIEFDLAITVESSSTDEQEATKQGGGGVKIHVVSAGVDIGSRSFEKS